MPFSVNDFLTNLDQYGERAVAFTFDVLISLPPALIAQFNGYGASELALQCEIAELPSIDVMPIEYRHYGFIKRIPFHLQFTPLTLTFYCTGQMIEKQMFDAWMNLMIGVNNGAPGLINYRLDSSGMPQYEGTIDVRQYDMTGNMVYDAQAIEAFPVNVSSIPVNWSDDSTNRVLVTFLYTKWYANQVVAPAQNPPPSNYSNS